MWCASQRTRDPGRATFDDIISEQHLLQQKCWIGVRRKCIHQRLLYSGVRYIASVLLASSFRYFREQQSVRRKISQGSFRRVDGCMVGNLGFLHDHCSRLFLMQASIPFMQLFQLIKRRILFLILFPAYHNTEKPNKNQFTWIINLRT